MQAQPHSLPYGLRDCLDVWRRSLCLSRPALHFPPLAEDPLSTTPTRGRLCGLVKNPLSRLHLSLDQLGKFTRASSVQKLQTTKCILHFMMLNLPSIQAMYMTLYRCMLQPRSTYCAESQREAIQFSQRSLSVTRKCVVLPNQLQRPHHANKDVHHGPCSVLMVYTSSVSFSGSRYRHDQSSLWQIVADYQKYYWLFSPGA